MHVAGKDQLESSRLESVERPRKVREENAQVGRLRKAVRIDPPGPADDQTWIHAHEPDRVTAELDSGPLVAQQSRGRKLAEVGGPSLRVARDGQVVIPEYSKHRLRELLDQGSQSGLASRMGQQIAGDAHQIRPTLRDPRDRTLNRVGAP
jgi:hypothetical protein